MSMPVLRLIVAVSTNGVIGVDGVIPWYIPEDFKWFKAITLGSAVVMGRHTHEEIGRALPGRTNFVVSRGPITTPGVITVDSLETAIIQAQQQGIESLFVIGGEQLYLEALERVDQVYVCQVASIVPIKPGQRAARFPYPMDKTKWHLLESVGGTTQASANPGLTYFHQKWQRK
jgi:dihydrofolate reductase